MRFTFEKAVEKYVSSMVRRRFSGTTLEFKRSFHLILGDWLSLNHQEAFQDVRGMSCDIIGEFIDYLTLKGLKLSTVGIRASEPLAARLVEGAVHSFMNFSF